MKVIDILNKIANYEKVKFKILDNDEIRDDIFEVENGHLRNSTCGKWLETKVSHDTWESISSYFLNEEVEIIEEDKKIEKIKEYQMTYPEGGLREDEAGEQIETIVKKINEIIDYLQSKGE